MNQEHTYDIKHTTLVVDFDSLLPGTLGEVDTFLFKHGKREVECTKEELFDVIERLLHG